MLFSVSIFSFIIHHHLNYTDFSLNILRFLLLMCGFNHHFSYVHCFRIFCISKSFPSIKCCLMFPRMISSISKLYDEMNLNTFLKLSSIIASFSICFRISIFFINLLHAFQNLVPIKKRRKKSFLDYSISLFLFLHYYKISYLSFLVSDSPHTPLTHPPCALL